jgi:hypothetical protein
MMCVLRDGEKEGEKETDQRGATTAGPSGTSVLVTEYPIARIFQLALFFAFRFSCRLRRKRISQSSGAMAKRPTSTGQPTMGASV